MIGLLGKKLGMTQLFDKEGREVPVTVLEVGPCHVTGVRKKDADGYDAVQLGFEPAKEKRFNKAQLGFFKKKKLPTLRVIREIRTEETKGLETGAKVGVDNFETGDFVDVSGVSIGKGFQGVIKRHNFKGALTMGHGDMQGRRPGSIGQSAYPSRVIKGLKGAGHMGNESVRVKHLKVVQVDQENNLLVVRGSVPGIEGGYLVVRAALRNGPRRPWKVQGEAEATKETPAKPEAGSEKPKEEAAAAPKAEAPKKAPAAEKKTPEKAADKPEAPKNPKKES